MRERSALAPRIGPVKESKTRRPPAGRAARAPRQAERGAPRPQQAARHRRAPGADRARARRLNDSLQALAYAALGQQGPQVRRAAAEYSRGASATRAAASTGVTPARGSAAVLRSVDVPARARSRRAPPPRARPRRTTELPSTGTARRVTEPPAAGRHAPNAARAVVAEEVAAPRRRDRAPAVDEAADHRAVRRVRQYHVRVDELPGGVRRSSCV